MGLLVRVLSPPGKAITLETAPSNQVTIPTTGTGYGYSIYWEDTSNSAINGIIPGPITGDITIPFPNPGIYRVQITGLFPRIYFNHSRTFPPNGREFEKILSVEQWGNIAWASMVSAFDGCKNLFAPATYKVEGFNKCDEGLQTIIH